jgi:hypothetical protein
MPSSPFLIPDASVSHSVFSDAQTLALAINAVLPTYPDIYTYLPKFLVSKGADDDVSPTGLSSTSALFSASGTINPIAYKNMLTSLQNFRSSISTLPVFRGVAAQNIRIVFTDSNKVVGFDSAKLTDAGASYTVAGNEGLNIPANAFPKIYTPSSGVINECHVGRIEFAQAEESPNKIAINTRWSGTLKQTENRAVFALETSHHLRSGLLAISMPAV